MKKSLNPRLASAAEFVRQGARFADIGTDHAYLPIFLLEEGRISYALCTDINEGPLSSARANAADRELTDKMDFLLTDGAAALSSYDLSDIAICGMGGDLIGSIVEAAEFLRDERINLILQPMTKQEALRANLYRMGYAILEESYSFDSGKPYVCMQVKYTGVKRELSEREREIHPENTKIANFDLQKVYLEKKISTYKKIIGGKLSGGNDNPREKQIAEMIEEYLIQGECYDR